jgi:chitinase
MLSLSSHTIANYGAYQTAINNISNEILLNHPSYYTQQGDSKRRKIEMDKRDESNIENKIYPNISSYGGFGIGSIDK